MTDFFLSYGKPVFDFLESGLSSFLNLILSNPIHHALRNREVAFLINVAKFATENFSKHVLFILRKRSMACDQGS